MFLTSEEIIQLTGRRRKSAQANELRQRGINHDLRGDGFPLVLKSYIEKKLGDGKSKTQNREPDWSAIETTPSH